MAKNATVDITNKKVTFSDDSAGFRMAISHDYRYLASLYYECGLVCKSEEQDPGSKWCTVIGAQSIRGHLCAVQTR